MSKRNNLHFTTRMQIAKILEAHPKLTKEQALKLAQETLTEHSLTITNVASVGRDIGYEFAKARNPSTASKTSATTLARNDIRTLSGIVKKIVDELDINLHHNTRSSLERMVAGLHANAEQD